MVLHLMILILTKHNVSLLILGSTWLLLVDYIIRLLILHIDLMHMYAWGIIIVL